LSYLELEGNLKIIKSAYFASCLTTFSYLIATYTLQMVQKFTSLSTGKQSVWQRRIHLKWT